MTRNLQPTRSTGLMTWLATHILSAWLVYVLAVLVALGEPVRAAVATAAPADEESPSTTSSEPQQLDPNLIQLCSYNEEKCEPWAPPPLLNLDQQIYFASAAQRASLRELEKQAVANVISDHSLTDADTIAVQTWGRDEVLAELFMLLALAIEAPNRTVDQQNAVDWLDHSTDGMSHTTEKITFVDATASGSVVSGTTDLLETLTPSLVDIITRAERFVAVVKE